MDFVRMLDAQVTVFHQGAMLVEGRADTVLDDPSVREVYLGTGRMNDAATSKPPWPSRGARPLLEVADLHAGYGHVPVLHGVSLELREGEALGIVGHNGMGKTTLLKAIMGLLPATGGRIAIDGVDVTRAPAHARSRLGIGYVPQGRGILPGLSAQENLRLAWTPTAAKTETSAIERVVGLFPRLQPPARPARRHAVGRRAADPGAGARAGARPVAAAARRAVRGHPAVDRRRDRPI